MNILSKIQKHKNLIILSLLIIAVLVILIRWLVKSKKEGFLSSDDDLINRNEVSTFDTIWSNDLYLNQFSNENKPENPVVFKNPKMIASSNSNYILGTVVSSSNNNENDETIMVNKDVKSPVSMDKIVEITDYDKNMLFTNLSISEIKDKLDKKDSILEYINKQKNLIDNFFKNNNLKEYIIINNGLLSCFYDNNSSCVNSKFELVKNANDFSKTISTNGKNSYFASVPVGSNVTLTLNNGTKHTITVRNGNNYQEIVNNSTGLENGKFNPFGKHGYNHNIQSKLNNAIVNIGKNSNNFMFSSDNNSSVYNFLNSILPNSNPATRNNITFLKLEDKYYLTDSISNINFTGLKYPYETLINQPNRLFLISGEDNSKLLEESNIPRIKKVIRDIYSKEHPKKRSIKLLNSTEERTKRCEGKQTIVRIEKSDDIKESRQDSHRIVVCARLSNKYDYNETEDKLKYVGTGNNTGFNKFAIKSNFEQANFDVGTSNLYKDYPFKGCEGFNHVYLDYYTNIDLDKTVYTNTNLDNLNRMEIKMYHSAADNGIYNSLLPKFKVIKFDTSVDGNLLELIEFTNEDNEAINDAKLAKFVSNLFMIKSLDHYKNSFKRTILNLLWKFGYVDFENGLFKYSIFNLRYNDDLKNTPVLRFGFDNIENARNFVATLILSLEQTLATDNTENPTLKRYLVPYDTLLLVNNNLSDSNITGDINNEIQKLKTEIDNYDITKDLDVNSLSPNSNNLILSTMIPLYDNNKLVIGYKSLIDGKIINNPAQINELKIRKIEVNLSFENNSLNYNYNKFNNNIELVINKIKNINAEYSDLMQKVMNKEFKHYKLAIHRPIAPQGYKCVGDVIESDIHDPTKNIEKYACVPENCVIPVRPWLNSDMVYEYENNNDYFAIFKNPYLNTFKTVLTRGSMPNGKVEKVVACVKKCELVDNIIHSDKCATEYKKGYSNIVLTNNLDRSNILYKEQDNAFRNMISNRQKEIDNIKKQIKNVTINDKKSNIINHSYNRARFQKLLDRQQYNMGKLIQNLYSIISVNINKQELINRLNSKGININDINLIRDTLDDLQQDDTTGTTESGNEADAVISKPAKLQRIIYQTMDGKKQELILRSLVESSIGCYFTDEELIKSR